MPSTEIIKVVFLSGMAAICDESIVDGRLERVPLGNGQLVRACYRFSDTFQVVDTEPQNSGYPPLPAWTQVIFCGWPVWEMTRVGYCNEDAWEFLRRSLCQAYSTNRTFWGGRGPRTFKVTPTEEHKNKRWERFAHLEYGNTLELDPGVMSWSHFEKFAGHDQVTDTRNGNPVALYQYRGGLIPRF